jgi:hypothetical protein
MRPTSLYPIVETAVVAALDEKPVERRNLDVSLRQGCVTQGVGRVSIN